MIQLSPYAERIIDRISMIGMWIAVIVCVRNFTSSCYYILIYIIMFKRLIVIESDKNSFWIRVTGIFLILMRFADWPYEMAFHTLQDKLMDQTLEVGSTCLAQWGTGVIILNFISDALANLFLSGMFVRRLYIHIRSARSIMSHRNKVIMRKILKDYYNVSFFFFKFILFFFFFFFTFTTLAFTVYFEIIESTLLVEALRIDYTRLPNQAFCEHCGMVTYIITSFPYLS
ncbi:hypothetical protein K501DRAFT_173969 [Backusella circina FSU 941]|nr:hypothetical protein K501DRAFT_173969 [Backusella circina FSU 941]